MKKEAKVRKYWKVVIDARIHRIIEIIVFKKDVKNL